MSTLRNKAQSGSFSFLFLILAIGIGAAVGIATIQFLTPLYAMILAVGIIVAIVTLISPEIGMLAMIFITYIRLSDVLTHSYSAPSIARPYAVLLLLSALLFWVRSGKSPQGWLRAVVLVGAYLLVVFTSLFYAEDPLRAQSAATDFLKDGILTVLIVMILQRKEMLRPVIWTLLVAGIFMGTLSVVQYATGAYDNTFFGFAEAPIQYITGGASGPRISGPIGDPNYYAQVMLVLIPLALNRMLSEKAPTLKLIAGFALLVITMSVILTFSRGGFIAMVVVGIVLLVYRRPRFLLMLTLLMLLVVLVSVLPTTYIERLSSVTGILGGDSVQGDVSFRGRASEMISAWRMFLDHPISGVGVGSYPANYLAYSRQLGLDPRAEARTPHNLYLEIAAETGLFGILVFGILLYSIFRSVVTSWVGFTKIGDHAMAEMVAAVGIGMTGYLAASMFIHAAYPRYFWLLTGIALSLPQLFHHALSTSKNQAEGEVSSPV